MRLAYARIEPVRDDEATPEQRAALDSFHESVRGFGLFRTMAREPEATRGLLGWGNYIQARNGLSARIKEIVVLRTSFRCRSAYEWSHHAEMGRRAGLTDLQLERLRTDDPGTGWADAEAAVIQACDQLVASQMIDEAVWDALCAHFSEKQRMDLVFTVAHYNQIAMITNAFGIQLDPGAEREASLVDCSESRSAGD